jgi:signal transduction histidine kinase
VASPQNLPSRPNPYVMTPFFGGRTVGDRRRKSGQGPICRLLLALVIAAWIPAAIAAPRDRLLAYAYEDTRHLVSLVEDAAGLVAKEGTAAFAEFAIEGSHWFDGSIYLFVYDLDGKCVFHAATPELVGRDLIDLRDLNGKPVIRYITNVGRLPEPDAGDWVFYLWQDGTQFSPSWKSAYIRKVVAPDGSVYVIGSGLYDIKIEKSFVATRIDRAADLLLKEGTEAAFKAFQDPSSQFHFLDTYIFVLDENGRTLVDPAFPNMAGRNLSSFQDVVGMRPVAEVLEKLSASDEAWVQYLWQKPNESLPSRKLIYARKVTVGDRVLIVGSDFYLATPIWMKVEDRRSWQNVPPG